MAKDRQIKAVIQALNKLAERVVIKLTLDLTANLIETTPVDTGWARANWVPAIGEPIVRDLSNLEEADRLALVGSQVGEQGSATAKVAASYKLERGKVFVSNNVPYILGLNEGTSAQAPAAFVQMAIAKAVTQDIRGLAT